MEALFIGILFSAQLLIRLEQFPDFFRDLFAREIKAFRA